MSEKILNSLGMLSDEMIAEALESSGRQNRITWKKIVVTAASLLLIISVITTVIISRNLQKTGSVVDNDSSHIASSEDIVNPGQGSLYVYYEGIAYVYHGYYDNYLPEGFEYVDRVNNIGKNIPKNNFDSNYDGHIYINENNSDMIYFRWDNWDEELEGRTEPFLILKPEK